MVYALKRRWRIARARSGTEEGFEAMMRLHGLAGARRFILHRLAHDDELRRQRRARFFG